MSISNDASRCGIQLNSASRELQRLEDPSMRRVNEAFLDYIMSVRRKDRGVLNAHERTGDVEVTLTLNPFSERNAQAGISPQDGRVTPRKSTWDDMRYPGTKRVDPTRSKRAYVVNMSDAQFRECLGVAGSTSIGNDFQQGSSGSGYKLKHYSLTALTMDNELTPSFLQARTRDSVRQFIKPGPTITLEDVAGAQAISQMHAAVDDAVVESQRGGKSENVVDVLDTAREKVCATARKQDIPEAWVKHVDDEYSNLVADIRTYNARQPENPIVDYTSTSPRGGLTMCVADPQRSVQATQQMHAMTGVSQQTAISVSEKLAAQNTTPQRGGDEPSLSF